MGSADALRSARVGSSVPIAATERASLSPLLRLRRISATPNNPTERAIRSMPSAIAWTSNVKRCVPEDMSVPIVPAAMPRATMVIAFSTEPWASMTEAIRPRMISEKYSGDPNRIANRLKGTASSATTNVAIVPAQNDPIAAMASAVPARPSRAIL